MIPITRAYAARTPKLTEAMTVKQRMMGIKNGVTIDQPLQAIYLMQRSTIRILRSFPVRHPFGASLRKSAFPAGPLFNLTAVDALRCCRLRYGVELCILTFEQFCCPVDITEGTPPSAHNGDYQNLRAGRPAAQPEKHQCGDPPEHAYGGNRAERVREVLARL